MEGLGLASVGDPYYDMTSHGTGYAPYHQGPGGWPSAREEHRPYCGTEFDNSPRYTAPIVPRRECTPVESSGTGNDVAEESQTEWTRPARAATPTAGVENGQDSPRQSQVAFTLSWLSENYERAEGVCLPRCVLYQHYLDFCKKMSFTPAGAATFGKIIRQRFPKLTTRRLGTRGQSKYHYYGIGIKETSIYYHSVYTGKGLTRFSGIKLRTEAGSRKYSLSSKTGTLLPEFPHADNLILPDGTDMEKMRTFILMYRAHCQRILDTIISANFDEVHNFLVHFWQGMPEHLVEIVECPILPDIIALCDSILYKVLIDVLIPSTIQEIPQNLVHDMKMFARMLPLWLESAMETVSERIQVRKLEVAKTFLQSLKRQSSFIVLAQTARTVLTSQETLTNIISEISGVQFADICSQAGFLDESANPKLFVKLMDFYEELKELLRKQAPIEAFTEWIDDMIDACVIQPSDGDPEVLRDKAAHYLLHWGAFGGLLMRELTLKGSPAFAAVHVVQLMLDEYAFLVVETQHDMELDRQLQKDVQKHMRHEEEIQTKPTVRNGSHKSLNSPKHKKRKSGDEFDHDHPNSLSDPKPCQPASNPIQPCPNYNGTAFTRPPPSNKEPQLPVGQTQEPIRPQHSSHPVHAPSLKSYPSYNSSYERPTYLPQLNLPSYPDYVGSNHSFTGSRLTSYSDSYTQPFTSNPFQTTIPPVTGNYWTDGRSHPSFADPYQTYGYNKLSATYDNLNKNTLLRNTAYQESFSRQAFETARPFYRGPHDNLQGPSSIPVGAYSSNFMDIAPPGGQYCCQDDLYPATMATTFAKPYISGPFR